MSPHNVVDNQDTIVSLPQSVLADFVSASSVDAGNNYAGNNSEIYFRPLAESEKNAVRFLRKVREIVWTCTYNLYTKLKT